MSEKMIEECVLKRIVHRFIEKDKAPLMNMYKQGKRLVPFNITKFKFKSDDIIKENEVEYTDYNGDIYIIGSGGLITASFSMISPPSGFGMSGEKVFDTILIPYSDYIKESRNEKIKKIGITLGDKVRKRIDEYLGFNSDDLFTIGSLVRIFGGAVRDAISDREIHDIDILLGSGSREYVENILSDNGYKYIESLTPKDLSSIYNDIRVINEPHSWVKGDKIVQIIRPAVGYIDTNIDKESVYKKSLIDLISNVDISCCGLSYSLDVGLEENYKNAILHTQSGVFCINKKAKMYSNRRITHRTEKLKSRGWVMIEDEIQINRDLKIKKIFN